MKHVKRSPKDDENLVLLVLLALDVTGHDLGPGSIKDLREMASDHAVTRLTSAQLIRFTRRGAAGLTDDGREEARRVAAGLAEAPRG